MLVGNKCIVYLDSKVTFSSCLTNYGHDATSPDGKKDMVFL